MDMPTIDTDALYKQLQHNVRRQPLNLLASFKKDFTKDIERSQITIDKLLTLVKGGKVTNLDQRTKNSIIRDAEILINNLAAGWNLTCEFTCQEQLDDQNQVFH